MDQAEENQHCASTTDIFGTATSFKLIFGLRLFKMYFNAIIHPLNAVVSTPIVVRRCSKTFAMSLNNTNEAPFLTFVSPFDEVTVFAPNRQEPIGKIKRRKAVKIADDEADILCSATNTKFTLKNVDESDDAWPPSMKIFDSNGIFVGTASVSKWQYVQGYIMLIEELSFHISDCISEPIKTMLVVAFTNWGMWLQREVNGRESLLSRCTTVIVFLIIVIVGLSLLVCFAVRK